MMGTPCGEFSEASLAPNHLIALEIIGFVEIGLDFTIFSGNSHFLGKSSEDLYVFPRSSVKTLIRSDFGCLQEVCLKV